jgi:hypothetical protein
MSLIQRIFLGAPAVLEAGESIVAQPIRLARTGIKQKYIKEEMKYSTPM